MVYGRTMRFGFVVPWGDADDVGDLAAAAEEAGWDGLFVWEPVWGVDAWISLGLAAMRTSRIRLGTLLTPPSRRRPWELAGQVATVDRLSDGRVTLSVGLGALDSGFETFGEECDRRIRAELMDECLDIACGLWGGQPFSYSGAHYHVGVCYKLSGERGLALEAFHRALELDPHGTSGLEARDQIDKLLGSVRL